MFDNQNMPGHYKVVEALLNLHKSRRSGILRFQRETTKKQVVLADGRIVFAESNVAEEHLARVMTSMGLLNRPDLNEIASLMKAGKTSEEAVLSITGDNKELLEKARRAQATRILASLLAWETCETGFYSGKDVLHNKLSLDLSVPELLVEAARNAASKHLRSTDLLFQELCSEDTDAERFPLNSAESLAFSLVCRQADPADRVSLFPPGKEVLEQSFSVLFLLGLIKTRSSPAESCGPPDLIETDPLVQQLEDMLSRVENSSAYEILSVGADAGNDEIQAAYHELARRFHPDRFESKKFPAEVHSKAERVFMYVKEAYLKLKDPVSRTRYDAEQKSAEAGTGVAPAQAAAQKPDEANAAESIFRQGRVFLARGEFEKAAAHLKTAVWLCPEKAAYHHYLGVAESENPKSRKSAEQHFLKAIELDFASLASRIALAKLYIQVNLKRKAEQLLIQVLQVDSENREAQRLLQNTGEPDSSRTGRHRRPFFG
jgi:curved DNA-binding protein CbpA